MKRNQLQILYIICFFCISLPVYAADIYVPGDFDTIQEAIYNADDGDTIHVMPGTYREKLAIHALSLVIVGEEGPSVTIIDAEGYQAPAVKVTGGMSKYLVLEGFTIRGGSGDTGSTQTRGGGLFIDQYTVRISNCIITGNQAAGRNGTQTTPAFGGGIAAYQSNLTVEYSEISNNSAGGGGIPFEGAGHGSSASGGGISCMACDVLIKTTSLVENNCLAGLSGRNDYYQPPVTGVNAWGGGLYADGGTLTVRDCTFARNVVRGGNTDDNFGGESPGATGGDAFGGGAYIVDVTQLDLEDTIIKENTSQAGYGISWY
jgi:hypothetical protein